MCSIVPYLVMKTSRTINLRLTMLSSYSELPALEFSLTTTLDLKLRVR